MVNKESACNAGDTGLIPGVEISCGEGNGYPLQYSCLENSMDRGAWQATYSSQGYKKSSTTEQLLYKDSYLKQAKVTQVILICLKGREP